MEESRSDVLRRHLRELIDAIDRRVPHIEREGEARIAQQARDLKDDALRRLAELEKDGPS